MAQLPFLTILLLTFLIITLTAASSTPSNLLDVIPRRRIKRSSRTLRQRSLPVFTLYRRNPVDFGRAPSWATKLPGDFTNSVGRKTSLGDEFAGCVKPLNSSSDAPTYPDTLDAAMILANKGDTICVPPKGLVDDPGRHCAPLAASKSASIYFCGAPGKDVMCSQISDAVLAFNTACVMRDGNVFRDRGSIAVLPPGYPEDITNLTFIVIDSPGLYGDV